MPAPDTNEKEEANAAKNTKKRKDTTKKRNGTPKHSQGPAHLGRDRARLGVPVDDALLHVMLRVPHQRACSQAPLVKGGESVPPLALRAGLCAGGRRARRAIPSESSAWTFRRTSEQHKRSAGEDDEGDAQLVPCLL